MKAKVLVEENADDIESDINKHLDKGWSLEGPVQLHRTQRGIDEKYVATVVKNGTSSDGRFGAP